MSMTGASSLRLAASSIWAQLWRKPPAPMPLGRWRYDADPLRRAELATRDCCGDDLCGTPTSYAVDAPAHAPAAPPPPGPIFQVSRQSPAR